MPVQLDRAGDVPGVVQQHVLVGLGHDQAGVVEVPGHPPGRDEHLRAGIVLEPRDGVTRQRHWYAHLLSLSARTPKYPGGSTHPPPPPPPPTPPLPPPHTLPP